MNCLKNKSNLIEIKIEDIKTYSTVRCNVFTKFFDWIFIFLDDLSNSRVIFFSIIDDYLFEEEKIEEKLLFAV